MRINESAVVFAQEHNGECPPNRAQTTKYGHKTRRTHTSRARCMLSTQIVQSIHLLCAVIFLLPNVLLLVMVRAPCVFPWPGQNPSIARGAGSFSRGYLWGMAAYSVFENLKRCLQVTHLRSRSSNTMCLALPTSSPVVMTDQRPCTLSQDYRSPVSTVTNASTITMTA